MASQLGRASIAGVVAAILPILAGRCWRERRLLLALMLWAAIVPALSLIFTAAVERTGGASNRDRQAIAQRIELTRSAEKEAKAIADAEEAAAKAECASGRKTKCLGLEARADQSRQRLEAAKDTVAKAGVVSTACRILPVSRGDRSLPASRSAGCDLGPRTASDLSRCPSAEAPKGAEAEGKTEAEAPPRQRPAAVVERGTPAASSLITPRSFTRPGCFLCARTRRSPAAPPRDRFATHRRRPFAPW